MIKVEICLIKKFGEIVTLSICCSHFIFVWHGNSWTGFAALVGETF